MKEKNSPLNPLETAAERIRYWCHREQGVLLYVYDFLSKAQEFFKKYKCALIKPPKIVSRVDHFLLQGCALARQKREAKVRPKMRHVIQDTHAKRLGITVDQAQSIHQKDLEYFQLENTLSSVRVTLCRHKEHFFVSKRLKNISRQENAGPKRHEIVTIKSVSKKELAKNFYPEESKRFQEERHFQISRF